MGEEGREGREGRGMGGAGEKREWEEREGREKGVGEGCACASVLDDEACVVISPVFGWGCRGEVGEI